ncbi:MAG: YicC/YloC family endoribonuclease [Flavobacteriaceae bacterium]
MIFSMTGYGKAEHNTQGKKLRIEIKSLNSKSLDLNFRVPSKYRGLELHARKELAALLHRGKLEVNVFEEWVAAQEAAQLNTAVVENYLEQLKGIQSLSDETLLPLAMRLPNVLAPTNDELSEEEQEVFLNTLTDAATKLVAYRQQEGISLAQDLNAQLAQIDTQLKHIADEAPLRIEERRQKLEDNLQQIAIEYDQERLEQELVYYLEKWDINEELVRLQHHLEYFHATLAEDTPTKGKKLGFIAQEIGREINTIGSKANDAGLQKRVVMMKDALERIKEQVLNAL